MTQTDWKDTENQYLREMLHNKRNEAAWLEEQVDKLMLELHRMADDLDEVAAEILRSEGVMQ